MPPTPSTSTGAQVRGTGFLGLVRYIRETRGASDLARVIEDSGPATRAVFSERIRKLSFYPYEAYAAFLRSADRHLGKGDLQLCATLGQEAGRRDLSSVFEFFTRLYGPERLIKSCTRVWAHYYQGAGRMEALAWEPDRTVLRIVDFPEMDPAHCKLMEGWMWRAMEIIGAQVVEGWESTCTSRGGDHHEFVCRWRPGG